jgi:hypothetical protein
MRRFKLLILLVCMALSANALAEFKLYEVDPSYREEVYQALAGVLRPGADDSLTNAIQLLPTGQILIDATPEAHQQVAAVLAEIRRHEAEPTPRVRLQYWVVLGARELANTADMPEALADVLGEIRDAHGPLSFGLLGNATLVTDSGMRGETSGNLRVNQLAYVQGTRLHAQLTIGFFYTRAVGRNGDAPANVFQNTTLDQQGLELNTSMEQGEFVVVGENSITDVVDGQIAVDGTIFYIVHWAAAD